jgi:hypothetical protein
MPSKPRTRSDTSPTLDGRSLFPSCSSLVDNLDSRASTHRPPSYTPCIACITNAARYIVLVAPRNSDKHLILELTAVNVCMGCL